MTESDDGWLSRFHAGERAVLAQVYEDHFDDVYKAVGRIVRDADQETVVHELFCRLVASESMRQGFHGGSLAAWLTTLGKNQAIDYARRYHREAQLDEAAEQPIAGHDEAAEAKLLIDRFVAECLPGKWVGVFETRFLTQLSQREAAAALGISRTTLAYQELRVRRLIEKYFARAV